jgi:hypothetical protein
MYYVDLNIGQELFNMLKFIATLPINTTSDNTTAFQPAISIVMHPAVGGFPSAWEFTLIIVVALLAISFLASGRKNVICLYPAYYKRQKYPTCTFLSLFLLFYHYFLLFIQ